VRLICPEAMPTTAESPKWVDPRKVRKRLNLFCCSVVTPVESAYVPMIALPYRARATESLSAPAQVESDDERRRDTHWPTFHGLPLRS
jgi:hypothetical protein